MTPTAPRAVSLENQMKKGPVLAILKIIPKESSGK